MKINNIILKIKLINPDLKFVGEFDDNNKKSGIWEYYYDNGIIQKRGSYLNGKKNGKWELFNINGTLKTKCTYKNDILDGNIESFFLNGYKNVVGYYENGLRHGEWFFYNETNNSLIKKIFFKNGYEVK